MACERVIIWPSEVLFQKAMWPFARATWLFNAQEYSPRDPKEKIEGQKKNEINQSTPLVESSSGSNKCKLQYLGNFNDF